jgi:hypothetical protein
MKTVKENLGVPRQLAALPANWRVVLSVTIFYCKMAIKVFPL